MALKKQVVTLEFLYDDEKVADPERWDWYDLLDIGPDELLAFTGAMDNEQLTEEDIERWKEYKAEQD